MAVTVHWQVAQIALDDRQVAAAVEAALAHGGRPGIEVNAILVDEPTLTEMHGRFLEESSPTDVMSFDLGEDGGGPAGEVFVSVDCARTVAAERGVSHARELALYLVHGTLHLCGMDDHDPEDRSEMRSAERAVLGALGYPDDPGRHD
ncbi:MAG: putative rRNA maturation factor [Chlamydiales bacterium]|jgi:probable rRNA maturation factor